MILATGKARHFVHIFLDDCRIRFVIFIDRFATLEIDVRVLGCSAHSRTIRSQRAFAASLDIFFINDLTNDAVFERFDFHHFVRSTETVKEMHRRDSAFQSGSVGDERQVLAFLYGRRAQHGKARLAAGHHVGMVAKNRKALRGKRAGCYMENRRGEFTRNLVHIRNHQEKALRCRKGGRQSSRLKCSVHRSCGTAFGLHFKHAGNLAPDILFTCRTPVVRMLGHRARRGNRIDSGDFAYLKSYVGGGFVTVNGNHLFCHR